MNDGPSRGPNGGSAADNDVSAAVVETAVQAGVVHGGIHLGGRGGLPAVPRQLPTHTPHFVGRGAELAWLDVLVEQAWDAMIIAAINGAAGIGKTALALRWAHKARPRFADGQLYVDLRGYGGQEPVTCSQALHGFLASLGIAPEAVPTDLASKAGLYRSLLNDRRMLVVLDNARDSEHVRPLLPGSPTCVVLVTSRNRLDGLSAREGAQQLTLDLLSRRDAVALLERRVGADRIADEPETATALAGRCARLPLALSIAAARAASRPGARLAELVEELGDENALLDALDLGEADLDLRTVFSWSYKALTPATRATFRMLGLHPGPDISDVAVASLIGRPLGETRHHLGRLAAAHLVEEHVPNRFRIHDLLRIYAAELACAEDEATRRAALRRLLDHYVHTSWLADGHLYAYREDLALGPPQPGVEVRAPAGYTDALQWFTVEHAVLLAVTKQAVAEGFDTHAWQLPWCMATYFDRRGHWLDYVSTLRVAAEAATRLQDRKVLAQVLRLLGRARILLLDYDEAARCCLEALRIHEELGDTEGQARTHRNLAMVHEALANYEDGLTHGEQARRLFQITGNIAGEARTLHTLGRCSAELGRYEEALVHCREAIRLFDELVVPDTQGAASAVEGLAYALHGLGRHTEAIRHYRRAIALWQQLGNRFYEASTLVRLGAVCRGSGDVRMAEESWRSAAEILTALNHPDVAGVVAELAKIDDSER